MPVTEELATDLNAAIDETVKASAALESEGSGDEGVSNENGEEQVDDAGAMGDGSEGASHSGEGDNEQIEVDGGNAGGEEAGGESEEAASRVSVEASRERAVLSDSIVAAAVNAGIPVSVALGMDSDEQLTGLVDSVMKTWDKGEEKKEKDKDPFADLPDLDPETYGKEAIEVFDRFREVIKEQQEQLNGLRDSHGELVSAADQAAQSAQSGAAREVESWFDDRVSELGDDYVEALGTGGYGDQAQGSSQFAKRDAIARNMAVMLAGYRASEIDAPPRDEIFQTAVRAVLGDDIAKINEGKLSKKLSKRSTQHIARASGQQSTNTDSAEDETARLLDEKFFKK